MKRLRDFLSRGESVLFQATATFKPLSGNDFSGSPLLQGFFGQGANLSTFLNTAFKTAITVGAILAVLRIVYAGVLYMTTDIFSRKKDAVQILQDAVWGMLLLLAVYLILNQINPDILDLSKIDLDK